MDDIKQNGSLMLHRVVYLEMVKRYNDNNKIPLKLYTYCDVPPGSGLGSSSSLVVSMIKCFDEMFELNLERYEIANLAYEFERDICGFKGGKQDQFAASFGGINFFQFNQDRSVTCENIHLKQDFYKQFNSSILLYYTGASRVSSNIIEDQSDQILNSDKIINSFHNIKKNAAFAKDALMNSDLKKFTNIMNDSWKNKKQSSKLVSNSEIDQIFETAINSGAESGKVSGAGGGGYMFFIVSPKNRFKVIRSLDKYNGVFYNANFTSEGAISWREMNT